MYKSIETVIPAIDETVTPEHAADIAELHFDLPILAREIREAARAGELHPFVFDGVSGLSERVAARLFGVSDPEKRENITYVAALRHDLRYYVGEPGDDVGRRLADEEFRQSLIRDVGMSSFRARTAWLAVRALGGAWNRAFRAFTWGFGRRG